MQQGDGAQRRAVILRPRPFGNVQRPVRIHARFTRERLSMRRLQIFLGANELSKVRGDGFSPGRIAQSAPIEILQRQAELDEVRESASACRCRCPGLQIACARHRRRWRSRATSGRNSPAQDRRRPISGRRQSSRATAEWFARTPGEPSRSRPARRCASRQPRCADTAALSNDQAVPSAGEAQRAQSLLNLRRLHEQVPQQLGAVIFDHDHNGALIDG